MAQSKFAFPNFAKAYKREIKDIPVPDRKVYDGVEVLLHSLLSPAQNGSDWSPSRPCRFIADEKAPPPPVSSQKRLVGPHYGVSAPAPPLHSCETARYGESCSKIRVRSQSIRPLAFTTAAASTSVRQFALHKQPGLHLIITCFIATSVQRKDAQ